MRNPVMHKKGHRLLILRGEYPANCSDRYVLVKFNLSEKIKILEISIYIR